MFPEPEKAPIVSIACKQATTRTEHENCKGKLERLDVNCECVCHGDIDRVLVGLGV